MNEAGGMQEASASGPVPIVSVDGLSKSFSVGGLSIAALKQISLDIFPGEFVVIYGPSGCGKTTLLSLMAGLERPTQGQVTIAGQNIYDLKPKELAKYRGTKVGMVFQQFNLI